MAITFNNKRQASTNIGNVTQAASYFYVQASGPTFTARSLTTAADMFTDTAVAGDYLLFGIRDGHCKPAGFEFNITTGLVAAAVTVVWEYRKTDGTWAALAGVTDNTTNFTVAGTNSVTWTMPSDWGTNATAVNGITGRMWVRARLSVATTLTEGGRTTNPLQLYDYAIAVDGSADYANGTATSGTTTTLTDSGKAWTTNELVGRGLYIHTGTNAGVMRKIISNTATQITILDTFDTAIDTSSQYSVGLNWEDIYQASVSGGWGVHAKAGSHSYAFTCFIRFGLATFIDFDTNVEFPQDFYFYVGEAHSSRYPMYLGWRPPSLYGLNRGIFGGTYVSNRTCPCDNRAVGFPIIDEYLHTAGNRFVLRHDYQPTGTDAFIRSWFTNYHRYSIDDRWEGWRSIVFPKTTTPRTEVRKPTVIFGHSGFETPFGSMTEASAIYCSSLGYFQTQSQNITLADLEITPLAILGGSRYGSPMQYFSASGTTNLDDYKGTRFRPMIDVYGSTPNTFKTNLRNSVRAFVSDEQGNLLANAKVQIGDSLSQNINRYLDFDSGDSVTAPNSATGNQIYQSTAFSVEAWINQNGAGGSSFGRILDKVTGSAGYLLGSLSNVLSFRVYTNGTQYTSNTITSVNGAWHHVIGVWDGSTVKLYYDNTTAAGTATTGAPNDDSGRDLYIGQRLAADSGWDGQIRRIRIFRNKALTAQEVETLWDNGNYTQNQSSPVSGCTAEYNFTEGTGTTLADTANGNTATLGAAAATPTWVDGTAGLSSNTITAYTGTEGGFLSDTDVVVGGSYSLISQPSEATRLRIVVTNFRDNSASSGANANIQITGTDADGNSIQEFILVDTIGNGTYFTQKEFLTVISSGIFITGMYGTLTIDNLGILPPQKVISETWRTSDDVNLRLANYNPIVIKVSRPGFEPVTIKKDLYEKIDGTIVLKRSKLMITGKV